MSKRARDRRATNAERAIYERTSGERTCGGTGGSLMPPSARFVLVLDFFAGLNGPMKPCSSVVTIFISLLVAHGVSFAAIPKTWIEVRTPLFIVVSNASEHDAHS